MLALVGALVWYLSVRYRTSPVTPLPVEPAGEVRDAPSPAPQASATATPAQTETPTQTETPSPSPSNGTSAAPQGLPENTAASSSSGMTPAAADDSRLSIPVAGVRPEDLRDTFTHSRSEGRTHNAIDIMAARNTPVVACADGRVVKLFRSDKGGVTLYQLSTDEKRVYYYAHLERYADGVHEGQFARRGQTIGYVGDSGNATPGNTHLHFEVMLISDPKRHWQGTSINPYPLLVGRQ